MQAAMQVVSIIVSIILIVLILLQVKGGGLGSLMGGESGGGLARTRRGLEKTIFQVTIALAIAFLAISIFSVIVFQS
ncbi:MAG: preprotein translocase subunit SecG [Anaerolineae bacterium]|nr:preprotein translocase subunit SecG [Anaerolineae bacterium]